MIPTHNHSGKFITFEGGEGAGKSTQISLTRAWLETDFHLEIVTTREPGGTPGAEEIRNLVVSGSSERWSAKTELLLMMAARADHLEKIILPALKRGAWVLCDRFWDSSRVYQGIAGALGLSIVDRLHEPILEGVVPDLTILIDIDPKTGLKRAGRRVQEGRFESKGLAFHEGVRDGFLKIAAMEPDRISLIEGSENIEQVQENIRQVLSNRFLQV